MVFCGRGSSGHVGVYLRYLFEVRLGMLASAAAPSVVTAYRRPPDFRDALFVVVSQSGRSPDLIDATQMARKFGALTLAIVNDEKSPAATASELVFADFAATTVGRARLRLVGLGRACRRRCRCLCCRARLRPRLRTRDRAQGVGNPARACTRL